MTRASVAVVTGGAGGIGPISVLVHCAVDFGSTALENLDFDLWRSAQRVNVETLVVNGGLFTP